MLSIPCRLARQAYRRRLGANGVEGSAQLGRVIGIVVVFAAAGTVAQHVAGVAARCSTFVDPGKPLKLACGRHESQGKVAGKGGRSGHLVDLALAARAQHDAAGASLAANVSIGFIELPRAFRPALPETSGARRILRHMLFKVLTPDR